MYGVMYLAGVSTFCTVAVLFVHHGHHQPRPVPRLLRHVILDVIASMLCMTNGRRSSMPSQSTSPDSLTAPPATLDISTVARHRGNMVGNEQRANGQSSVSDAAVRRPADHQQSAARDDWIEMARVIDRFCFVIFSVVIVGMTSLILILMAVNGPHRKIQPISL